MDFGKPFRSKSLEIIGTAKAAWAKDGWVGVHNSYLHILYRTGIVGILLILFILAYLCIMIKDFYVNKSIIGLLLCGVIINWFIAANFLLIFELPYMAIPIWCLYGVTWAYHRDLLKLRSIAN